MPRSLRISILAVKLWAFKVQELWEVISGADFIERKNGLHVRACAVFYELLLFQAAFLKLAIIIL